MHGNFSQLIIEAPGASRVLQQQGRVLLDADWNAAGAVLLSAQRHLAADLIGPHGGPASELGFAVGLADVDGDPDLAIGVGVYYVDGIRVAVAPRPDTEPLTWRRQPYPPWPDRSEPPALPEPPYLVYLDVWERHVDAVQDDGLREVGLGGPDTVSVAQIVWQVRAATVDPDLLVGCQKFPVEEWRAGLVGARPRLRAWAGRAEEDDDPCLAAPDSGYRGVENQLYRVEITDVDGEGAARFLWSRENGSVTASWLATDGDRLVVAGMRDRVLGFAPDDWLELTWDELELAGVPGPRVRVTAVDGGLVSYADASGTVPADPRLLAHPVVRRWDARRRTGTTLHAGALDVVEGEEESGRVALEDGISVQFLPPVDDAVATRYRVGDYWTIPARVATGDIVWPRTRGEPDAVGPQGVEHHYAPLAAVGADGKVTDMRRFFTALARCR
ncbi:hypothetical protein E8D34_05005 [Nocardioides sp. GY 10113]|uniref:DUF6519 domain-containing protein n=1 Tax=Nocardioides sp. GY 10113 TaxID=2569761 RepID=UPI0010A8978B|nr:DUF6519 domain-containing protein [Nocardioides sp. GY 10113]TIC88301.1 hypothetical protein E8D34_05005 [Nocardioides sp. GY 10113]